MIAGRNRGTHHVRRLRSSFSQLRVRAEHHHGLPPRRYCPFIAHKAYCASSKPHALPTRWHLILHSIQPLCTHPCYCLCGVIVLIGIVMRTWLCTRASPAVESTQPRVSVMSFHSDVPTLVNHTAP
ncbi:hypothetical protein OBBRIDRAFT_481078 [Obba rivulosa]|uniref:Uncharacterized protein n=1 Tax=Obba rivulosa TaxID=1052685 RepID=A0A8E2AZN1_9APHY|nr:hypothetical protein OBBRIDRAFT_481078 [Obba rivulosa]